jgi:3-isopropylmalate dehydrogenase
VEQKHIEIALTLGDGAGPELMRHSCNIVESAARQFDGLQITWVPAPMGWSAYQSFGDTFPGPSLETVQRLKVVYFGGVGDFSHDELAREHPEMSPEPRVLKGLRRGMGLLMNHRPVSFVPELIHLSRLRPDLIPGDGITMYCIRFLLEDVYFGNEDLLHLLSTDAAAAIGLKRKQDVTGLEERVTMLGYFSHELVERYFHGVFQLARRMNLPVVNVDKKNIEACSEFWHRICVRLHDEQYPDVPLSHLYIDAACARIFHPADLNAVIALQNMHGDIFTDTATEAAGGMGMMCSSAVNPTTGAAMFESGAGTAPTLVGKNVANPIGRILTGAMMLDHIGAPNGAKAIRNGVAATLKEGYRTTDLFAAGRDKGKPLSTTEIAAAVMSRLGV